MVQLRKRVSRLKAADKVYQFLGARGMVGTGVIQAEEPINGANFGDLIQYRRNTRHELNKDYWRVIFDFADAYFARQVPSLSQRSTAK